MTRALLVLAIAVAFPMAAAAEPASYYLQSAGVSVDYAEPSIRVLFPAGPPPPPELWQELAMEAACWHVGLSRAIGFWPLALPILVRLEHFGPAPNAGETPTLLTEVEVRACGPVA